MKVIWSTIIHTPLWVYALLGYLIKVGIQASKISIISLQKSVITLAIFLLVSVHTLKEIKVSIYAIIIWGFASFIGTTLGWLYTSRDKLQVDKELLCIQVPGTWITMIIIVIIFSAKYYLAYNLAINHIYFKEAGIQSYMLFLSSICVGLLIGRSIYYICVLLWKQK